VVERGVLEKLNRYLVENSTKSLCQPEDSDNLCFPDLLCFGSFCASVSKNLVTVEDLKPSRTGLSHTHIFAACFWDSTTQFKIAYRPSDRQ
jgi:hypothetical protein